MLNEVELVGRVMAPAVRDAGDDDLLAQLTVKWLNRYKSVHTQAAYRRDLGRWIGWCQGHGLHPLTARVGDVDDWLAWQRDSQQAARRSIARRLSAVASWYKYLIINTAPDPVPLITYNPAAGANRPDVDRDQSPTVALSRAEADRLITTADADGPRSSALVRYMLTNAPRVDEVCSARIEDLGHDRGYRTITTVVKGDHRQRDPLPTATVRAVDAYLASRGNPSEGPLFATRTGRHMTEPGVAALLRRLTRKAGIKARITPHGLRKTAITEALNATGDLRRAQDLAHHADPRTTRLYDADRGALDGHAAHVLATRYGAGSCGD